MVEYETTQKPAQDAKRPFHERLVIFFQSLITRTYFYSGEVHFEAGAVKHTDGVLEITSMRRKPKLAWQIARADIVKALECAPHEVHLQTIKEI